MLFEIAAFTFAAITSIQPFAALPTLLLHQPEVPVVSPLAQKPPSPTPTSTPTPTNTPTPLPTETPTPTQIPTPIPITSPQDLTSFFEKYSNIYHVDENLLKKIAKCESGFNAQAENGPYAGIFQFADQTWIAVRTRMGENTDTGLRKNPEEAIKTAAYYIASGGQHAWSGCL